MGDSSLEDINKSYKENRKFMRLRISITGLVQGVGFRPFVFRLAEELGLKGYVLNNMAGVLIEVEGEKETLDTFLVKVDKERPEISRIFSLQHSFLKEKGFKNFEIRKSLTGEDGEISILPDIAVCEECLKEITDPEDRRFLYLFTNCTNCGPRFSIIRSLPYDRGNTSMKDFKMCFECGREYSADFDRRFHAQPNACHACGPWIRLYNSEGDLIRDKDEALEKAVDLIRKGNIIAVKGVGGYHLVCDATDEDTVNRLRIRKQREEKPMAVMFPDLDSIKVETDINALEERALKSVEKPIVIVKISDKTTLAKSVSPENSTVGVFLPYSPLHHIMMRKIRKPVIATSANITDEPVVKDEKDAFTRLSGIADYILTHNRDIVRRCDDSVVRIAAERQVLIRRSRGFAPMPVTLPIRFKRPVLALGPHMNNTIAIGIDNKVYISQHIGDLDTPLAMEFFEETVNDLLRLLNVKPEIVASDMHPGYYSSRFGEKRFRDRITRVQHHFAHILSCMAENDVPEDTDVIGFAFDGTGYGTDRTIWGSEALIVSYKGFRRVSHLRPFRLPGGEKSVKEPCRSAFSLLYETFSENAKEFDFIPFTRKEMDFFINMMEKNINSPVTTSMGRLFDGVSSIINLKHRVSYHSQAAVSLEQIASGSDEKDSYPFSIKNNIIDYRPIIEKIVYETRSEVPREITARKFHNTITGIIIQVSESVRKETGIDTVALSGGVFQNSILLENSFNRLKEKGFIPLIHQIIPANDGGISLGQAVAAGTISNYNK